MSTVDDILSAVGQLDPFDFIRWRQELDRLEEQLWEAERERATEALDQAEISDEDIDRMVLRRRREGRS